ncbi:MAG: hypothetical protein KAI66_08480, partial [Lentisphaeria bacterium]|nr:hypothetical protein [Lentisphaeria bacterium]
LAYDAPTVRISGHGGGKWYNFFIHGMAAETDKYRHILIDGARGPLAFYHLHAQHAQSFSQCEIRNSRDVSVYGVKAEYQTRFLVARDSSGIRIFGHGGNATAARSSAHYLFIDCKDFLLSNMDDQFSVWKKTPASLKYRKYPAEPFTQYHPLIVTDGGTTTAIPYTEHPILWRSGEAGKNQ